MRESFEDRLKVRVKSDDRTLVLKPLDETKSILNSTGLIDNRLYKGGNTLHGMINPASNLWCLKYEVGGLPQDLKQEFTSFEKLLRFASKYFTKRNLKIVEIID